MKSKPRILFLVPEDYAALQAKGITHMILERDEKGFFEKVITVHPIAYKTQVIKLNKQHTLYEFNLRKLFYPTFYGLLMPFLPIKFLIMIFHLLRVIRSEKIDLIRATDPYLMGLIAWILSRITGIPYCISIHSDYPLVFALNPQTGFKKLLRTVARWIPDFVSPRAHMMLPISGYLKRVISNRVKDDHIKVIYHGIDFQFEPESDLKKKFNLPDNKKIISYVARLSNDNYVNDILKTMEKLLKIRNDFILVMVGGGELEEHIKQWIAQQPGREQSLYLLGFQPNHIGRSIRYISDISLCLMSGFSLIEAAAAETPLISYDIEWHYELVTSHVTGFLVREHDLDNLTKSICYLLDHPHEAMAMGKNARKIAMERHELKQTMHEKQLCYSNLIHKG